MLTLNYIFNICILIGFVIPLLNLITGWFGSFLGAGIDIDLDSSVDVSADVSIDASVDAGMDAGAETNVQGGGLIPFNIMCLCLALVVFGAVGHMLRSLMTFPLLTALLLLGCLIMAGLAYWALYKLLIVRLKNSDSTVMAYKDLRGKSAEVTLSIRADSVGTISMRDSTGAPISFRAKIDPDLKSQMPETIQNGETVVITEVDLENKQCFVSLPFRKFTDSQ